MKMGRVTIDKQLSVIKFNVQHLISPINITKYTHALLCTDVNTLYVHVFFHNMECRCCLMTLVFCFVMSVSHIRVHTITSCVSIILLTVLKLRQFDNLLCYVDTALSYAYHHFIMALDVSLC